jgi:anaerobic magnesium-protoporphyrin IX monomethyl ester cyclase
MPNFTSEQNSQNVGTIEVLPDVDSEKIDSVGHPDRDLIPQKEKPSSRLLFIGLPNGGSRPGKAGLFLPLGLAYVTAALKEQGYTYDCIDLHTEQIMQKKPFDFWDRIQDFDLSSYDIIAFGGVFLKFEDLRYLSSRIKENYSHIFQIVGGNMATMTPDVVLERTQVDCVCLYEGEETIVDLVQTLEKRGDWKEVRSIKYRDQDGQPVESPSRPKLTTDKVPHLPDRDAWNFDLIRKAYPVGSPGRYSAVAFASRGCPFSCTFCKPLTGKEIRSREIDSIIREIKYLKEHWNVQYIRFFDEVFIGSKYRIKSLCEAMIEENLNIFWWCQTQVRLIDEDLLKVMKKAGCIEIAYGVESGSDTMLEDMKKGISVDIIRDVLEATNRSGIRITLNLLAGTPAETVITLKETRDFLISLNHINWANVPSIEFVVPLPGTELFDTAVQMNLIKNPKTYVVEALAKMEKYSKSINMTTMSSEEFISTVEQFNKDIARDFYKKHPSRYLMSIFSLDHLRWDLILRNFTIRQFIPLLDSLAWATIGKHMHNLSKRTKSLT